MKDLPKSCTTPGKTNSTSQRTPSTIQISDCVWYYHKKFNEECQVYDDLKHVGVVVDIVEHPKGDVYFVAWSVKGCYPDRKPLPVLKNSQAGSAIRLDQDRYFYKDNYKPVLITKIKKREGRCPPELLSNLRALVGAKEK